MSVTRVVLQSGPLAVGEIAVPAETAHHARVSRVREGDPIELLDLAGTVGIGRLARWRGNSCVVLVESLAVGRGEPPEPVVLGLGLLHTAAFDWAVEKATELGATVVAPVVCARVQGKIARPRLDRWERIAAAAVAQCGRSRPPAIRVPVPLERFLAEGRGFRLLADGGAPPLTGPVDTGGNGIVVLIGPEGGFTEEEIGTALRAGFVPMTLGPRTLRAETAAVAALATAQQRAGWLG
jgi:16S rRNA (uracil1498-N3)-methyltransferase